ncbi:MAG: hypothetical protein HYY65_14465 [Candidatus Tectomicrobia bacterium]|uniref:Uncharacterized protein n=1 Tax=Tectimicrobiota bacterium TaxID=2528274 RepID=A0A932GSB9_UNCTE|nr:hypothetical protein [Candidatus Tectomicrobia bacterium]
MTERAGLQILFHGAIVLFVGLLCGFPFAAAVTGAWGDETVRAWRLAHVGLAAVGIWLIATGAALPRLALGDRTASVLVWSVVMSAYAFVLALLIAPVAGMRGLEPFGSGLNWIAFASNMVGTLGALLGGALMIIGAHRAVRAGGLM